MPAAPVFPPASTVFRIRFIFDGLSYEGRHLSLDKKMAHDCLRSSWPADLLRTQAPCLLSSATWSTSCLRIFSVAANSSPTVEMRRIVKEAPWVVVWGLHHANLTDLLRSLLDTPTAHGLLGATIGAGFIILQDRRRPHRPDPADHAARPIRHPEVAEVNKSPLEQSFQRAFVKIAPRILFQKPSIKTATRKTEKKTEVFGTQPDSNTSLQVAL